MKKYLLSIFLLLMTAIALPVFAANTSGSAWSESVGWFNFSNATVSSSNITGHAYNDNTGWLVLDGITNSGGTLSGYAWSESVGYFDFSDVVISSGAFSGQAYNDNTGWLSFGAGTNVTTTWRSGGGPTSPCVYNDPAWSTCSNGMQTRTLIAIDPYCWGGNTKAETQACIMPATTATPPATTATPPDTTATPPPASNVEICNIINSLQTSQIVSPAEATSYRSIFNCNVTTTTASATIINQLANNSRDLKLNMIGEDVKLLQQFLNQQGYLVNPNSGQPGSIGYETTKFGSYTRQALIRFQKANNIAPAVGYFGPITRAFIKTLLTN